MSPNDSLPSGTVSPLTGPSSLQSNHASVLLEFPQRPTQSVSLAWLNLTYTVPQLTSWRTLRGKTLLHSVSGHFAWHSLNGILGPSGAGKTTLLHTLSGLLPSGRGPGSLYLDGSRSSSNVRACLIEQRAEESIVGQLTVGQILTYAFYFKNGRWGKGTSLKEHLQWVCQQMMLPQELLGRPFAKCSGGEQKRVAIGQQLMATAQQVDFLFIDEPTSGLDSTAALQVATCLKGLTLKYRMTIVVSIHVPSEPLLGLFDCLYILARGGTCIYSGPPGQLQGHLEGQLALRLPEETKPIEEAIRLACKGPSDAQVSALTKLTLDTQLAQVATQLTQLTPQQSPLLSRVKSFTVSDLVTHTSRQLRIAFLASRGALPLQLLFYMANVLLIASLFNHSMVQPSGCYSLSSSLNWTCQVSLGESLLQGENLSFLCFTRILQAFLLMVTSCNAFTSMASSFRAEYRNGWYSLPVFYLSLLVVSLLELTLFTGVIASVSYFASEQHAVDGYGVNWARLGHYTAALWLAYFYLQSFAQLLATISLGSSEVSIALCTLFLCLTAIFDDFFFQTDTMNSPFLLALADALGMKHTTRYLIYAIYGADRCHPETEASWVLAKHTVNRETLFADLLRVALKALFLRFFTFLCLAGKCSPLLGRLLTKGLTKICQIFTESSKAPQVLGSLNSDVNCNPMQVNETPSSEMSPPSQKSLLSGKILLAWRHLTLYSSSSHIELGTGQVPSAKGTLLCNVSGQVTFGTLTGLMGMSGAGKTSLLRALNGQSASRLSEETRFYLSTRAPITTCFLTQDVSHHLLPGLTARQMLIYASRLKNLHCTAVDHAAIARRLLNELALNDVIDSDIARCSGGERKRLALAVELTAVRMPNLVCIDEPTSGLDSTSAEKIVTCLRETAARHCLAIVASIHQPGAHLLVHFQQLIVLARGGICVYSGTPRGVKTHLEAVQGTDQQVESKIPIEVLIKHSCAEGNSEIVQQLARSTERQFTAPSDTFLESSHLQPVLDGIPANRVRFSLASTHTLLCRFAVYFGGYLWKPMALSWALYLFYGWSLSLFFDASIAAASGCVTLEDDFNQTCNIAADKEIEVHQLDANLKYNLFSNALFLSIVLMQASVGLYLDLPLFFNEHRNGWYSTGAFYLVKCLFEVTSMLPILLLYVALCNIYASVVPAIYLHLLLLYTLAVFAFQGWAHLLLLLSRGQALLLFTLTVYTYTAFLLLGNVVIRLSSMHYIWRWLANFSVTRFSLEGGLLLQYGFDRCPQGTFSSVLAWMQVNDDHYYTCLRMLLLQVLLYRAVALYLLIRRANPVENRRERAKQIRDAIFNR